MNIISVFNENIFTDYERNFKMFDKHCIFYLFIDIRNIVKKIYESDFSFSVSFSFRFNLFSIEIIIMICNDIFIILKYNYHKVRRTFK